jgi:hypothetical protein
VKNISININYFILTLLVLFSTISSQVLILQPKSDFVSQFRHLTIIVAGKPGAETTLFVNGEETAKGIIRVDGKYDYINIEVPPGPAELKVSASGARGKIYTAMKQIQVAGDPYRINTIPEEINLPADGKSTQEIEVNISDKWGTPLKNIKLASLFLYDGRIIEPDLDSVSKGHQLSSLGGTLTCQIIAGKDPSTGSLDIQIGGLIKQIPVKYHRLPEPIILVGYANGTLIGKGSNSDITETNDFMGLENKKQIASTENMDVLARSALYMSGTIFDNYQLTANYDSGKQKENQLFDDVDMYDQYPIYGDNSQISYESQTSSPLFINIARDKSFITFGDFNTGLQSTELASYNRSLNGLISSVENENHKMIGFISKTSQEMILDEIRGSGISGYYMLTNADITRLSEIIILETRDNYHSEQIINRTHLKRYIDYDIDYQNGSIMFKQPVLSSDSNGNPIYIMTYYEHDGNNSRSLVGGMRYEGSIQNRIKFGSTVIVEEQAENNYQLYGFDSKIPITKWMTMSGEYAWSSTPTGIEKPKKGDAYKIGLKIMPIKDLSVESYFREVDSSFVNHSQSGSASEKGSKKYGLSGSYHYTNISELNGEYYRQYNHIATIDEEHLEVTSLKYTRNVGKKYKIGFGYQNAVKSQLSSPNLAMHQKSRSLISQIKYKNSEKINTHLEYNHNFQTDNALNPSYLQFGLDYFLTPNVELLFKRRITQSETHYDETIFGIESTIKENTTLSAKYQIGGALGNDRSRAIIGLQNKWSVTEDFTLNISIESTVNIDSLQTPVNEHNSFSCSFEYFPEAPTKLSGKFEDMNDKTTKRNLYSISGAPKLKEGISFIIKSEHSSVKFKKYVNERVIIGKYRFGIAFRPEKYDFINSLLKFELLSESNTHVKPEFDSKRLIFSLHTYYQALNNLGFGIKYARRSIVEIQNEIFDDNSQTDYFMLRTEWNWAKYWGLAVDLRAIITHNTNEVKTGSHLEINHVLKRNMQIGIGYIFNYYQDSDFAVLDYNNNRLFLNLNIKFSEDMFNWK